MANKFLDLVTPNIDKFGIIAQSDGDGGDSVLHEADLVFCAYIQCVLSGSSELNTAGKEVSIRFNSLVSQFVILEKSHKPSYGLLRRHPDLEKWYSRWNLGSRDQGHSIVAMAIAAPEALKAYLSNWSRRLFLFTTNTVRNGDHANQWKLPDFTGPGFWAYAIRCCLIADLGSAKLLRHLLPLFDFALLANSLVRVYIHGKDKEETDSRNHMKAMALSKLVCDTWLAKLARLIYRRIPQKAPVPNTIETQKFLQSIPKAEQPPYFKDGQDFYLSRIGAQQEIDNYFYSNGGVKGLAQLYRPVVLWTLNLKEE